MLQQENILAKSLICSPEFAASGFQTRSPALQVALCFGGGATWLRASLASEGLASMREAIGVGRLCGTKKYMITEAIKRPDDLCPATRDENSSRQGCLRSPHVRESRAALLRLCQ